MTTTATRDFHIGDVLSVTSGKLVSPTLMAGVHEFLDWMTGDTLFTHQLPRATDECAPALRAQHPDLTAVDVPDDITDEQTLHAWLQTLYPRFGEHVPVAPLPPDDHTRIDPITELRTIAPDTPIVVVRTGTDGPTA